MVIGKPLSRVLRLNMALFGLAVVLVIGPPAAVSRFVDRRDAMERQLAITASLSADSVDTFIQAHSAALRALAGMSISDDAWEDALHQTQHASPAFISLILIGTDGHIDVGVVTDLLDDAGFRWHDADVSDRAYFQQAMRTRAPYVSDVFRGRGFGSDPIVAVSVPVLDRGGRPKAVLEGSITASSFVLAQSAALSGSGMSLLVVDRAQQVVYASAGTAWQPLDTFDRRTVRPARYGFRDVSVIEPAYKHGENAIAVARSLSSGWTVYVLTPAKDFVAGVVGDLLYVVLPGFFVALVAVLLSARMVSRRLAAPVELLERHIASYSVGAPSEFANAELAPLEIQSLIFTFDRLADDLNTTFAKLHEADARKARAVAELDHELTNREKIIADRTRELEEANGALLRMAHTDPLTGVMNKRGFDDTLSVYWHRAVAHDKDLALISCDVDQFKAYNDHYGHPAGDVCLQRVIAAMRAALRGEHDFIARVGGEEFTAVLPDISFAQAFEAAERMRLAVMETAIPHVGGIGGVVTISCGVASRLQVNCTTVSALIGSADAGLYRAKENGRNRVSV